MSYHLFSPTDGTIVADPRFVDAAHEDLRYQPDSPARQLGTPELPVTGG